MVIILGITLILVFIILDSFLAISLNRVPIIHNKNGNGLLVKNLRCDNENDIVWKNDKKKICESNSQENDKSEDKPKDKILLELPHEIDLDKRYGLFGTEPETTTVDVKIDNIKLEEISPKWYKNDNEITKILSDYIYKNLNIKLDAKWKYNVHFYNPDDGCGDIFFVYHIDENISTNRFISFFFDNGVIERMTYAYLDTNINEDFIKQNVRIFNEYTIQEKKEFSSTETFEKEEIDFSYNFRVNKTFYTYCLYFYEEPFFIEGEKIELVNNDYGSAYIVEDFLKENNLS